MSQLIIKGIHNIGARLTGKKIFLVKDNAFEFLEIKSFFGNYSTVGFSDFTPNPLYEQVVKGIKAFHDNACDTLVAVGGGSAIDVAKCIKLFCKMDPMVNYLDQERSDSGIPLIAIPTTAGTGSESTCHAVIYYGGVKQSISHPSIVPDVAVLEPSVLQTLPVYQKKCTMLDALCQGIESLWSVNSTAESKSYAQKAVKTIRDNLDDYIEKSQPSAAERIMEAANYAGRSINITATTAAHAMSYKLTSLYSLPHGHAVAICLPKVWRYIAAHSDECTDPRGSEYLEKTLSEIPVTVEWFEALLEKLGIVRPTSTKKEIDLVLLSESVNPIRLKNTPVTLSIDTIKSMYEVIVE